MGRRPCTLHTAPAADWFLPGGSGRAAGSGRVLRLARGLAHGIEPVAGAAHRDDLEAQLPETAQLLPEPADVDVDCLAVPQVVVAPDLLEQDLTGKDSARAAHQVGEQFPLLGRQLQLGVVDHGPPSRPVDAQPAEPVLLELRTNVALLTAAK